MGTFKVQRLTDAEIVARYVAGEGRGILGLRAKLPDYRVTEILTAAGVRLRGTNEAIRLSHNQRKSRRAKV